jgi:glutamate carboxypeptidase
MDSLAIERFVDENGLGIKELLKKTVDMYSPSCDAASVTAVGDVFAEELLGLGFCVSRPQGDGYGAHVLADLDTGKPGPRILLMGHMDTVELPAAGYDHRMRVDGDLIRGLGVQDMKGGDVILAWALRALKNAGGLKAGSIRVFLNAEEEPGSPHSRKLLPSVLEGVDYALLFEGAQDDGSMTASRKGCGVFRITVHGRASHAGADPEKGRSAIHELAEKILTIEALKGNGTTLNVGIVKGGTAAYVVPEYAEAVVDVRVPSPEEQKRIEQELARIAGESHVPDTRTEILGSFHRPPMPSIPGGKALQELTAEWATKIGFSVRFVSSGGVGDLNNIVAAGIPGLDGFGTDGGGPHGVDEHIRADSLVRKTKLAALVIESVLEGRLAHSQMEE